MVVLLLLLLVMLMVGKKWEERGKEKMAKQPKKDETEKEIRWEKKRWCVGRVHTDVEAPCIQAVQCMVETICEGSDRSEGFVTVIKSDILAPEVMIQKFHETRRAMHVLIAFSA